MTEAKVHSRQNTHCKKRKQISALCRKMPLHKMENSLCSKRNIYTATHSFLLRKIGRDRFHQQGTDVFHGIQSGDWEITRKLPSWWEKCRCGNGKRSEKFRHGRKNSGMVGKKKFAPDLPLLKFCMETDFFRRPEFYNGIKSKIFCLSSLFTKIPH